MLGCVFLALVPGLGESRDVGRGGKMNIPTQSTCTERECLQYPHPALLHPMSTFPAPINSAKITNAAYISYALFSLLFSKKRGVVVYQHSTNPQPLLLKGLQGSELTDNPPIYFCFPSKALNCLCRLWSFIGNILQGGKECKGK